MIPTKNATTTVQESDHLFRTLFDCAPDAMFLANMDTGVIEDANQAATKLILRPRNEIVGLHFTELHPQEMVGRTREHFHTHLQRSEGVGDLRPIEHYARRSDGISVPIEVMATILDFSGDRKLLGIFRDITSRKLAEEALRESEERYRETVELAVDGILLGSADGKIIGANSQMQKWLGRPLEQLLGLHVSELFDPEELKTKPLRFDLLNLAQLLVNERNLRRADGTSLLVEMHSKKMPDGTYQSIYRDISERKKYEEELKTLNDELERRVELRTHELQETQSHLLHAEKLSAIGRLSASIAHEFNNPLQGVMTILKGFQKTLALEGQERVLLDLAFSECERMKNLIRSLQDFNRPSSGRKVFMDVHETLDSLLLLSKSDLKRKGISTVLNYDKRLPQILAIPDQIKQVLLNLLQNAADACNGNNGVITISTCQMGERIAVAIRDNGIGIASDNFTKIFQPFYTTKPEVKGTGLGLSICHGIVQNHQGEIRVESEPGKGSTFTVLLPIAGESS